MLTRLTEYWDVIWSDFAAANRILKDGFVGAERGTSQERVARRDYLLTASAEDKSMAGQSGARSRWKDATVSARQIEKLHAARAEGLSFRKAGEAAGLSKTIAYFICTGTYHRLQGDALEAWKRLFSDGDPAPPPTPLPWERL